MDYRFYFYIFLSALTLFRVAFSGWFDLSMDEAYYWMWGKHPAFSYYDHPPMVGYFIALTTVLSDSERWVRLGVVLSSSAATWIIFILASDIFNDRRYGLASAILFNLIPLYAIGTFIMTPDAPLCLFWALSLYYGHKICETQKAGYWYSLGVVFGLGLLSKYNMALFAPAMLAFLLISVENRHWLFRKEPYLAFIMSFVIFSPVILWNATHGWASLGFQFSHGFDQNQSTALENFSEFWAGQLGLYGLFLFFFLLTSSILIGWMGYKKKRDDFVYLSVMSLSLVLFFVANSLRTRMEGNWSVTMFMAAIVATPGWIAFATVTMRDMWANILTYGYRVSLALSALLVIYAHVQIVDPVLPMPEHVKFEMSKRYYGFSQLGSEADKLLSEMSADSFILANRHQIATLLDYYTELGRETYMTDGKGRFNFLGTIDHLPGKDALYVTVKRRDEIERIKPFFEKATPAGSFKIERRGMLVYEFLFYRLEGYKGELIKI